MGEQSALHPMEYRHGAETSVREIPLLCEDPLSIRIQGKPYGVLMRTPGDEIPLLAGFCLSEGIVDRLEDFGNLSLCEETNVVTATLAPARGKQVMGLLEQGGYISRTGCGICGKETMESIAREIPPPREATIDLSAAVYRLKALSEFQPLRDVTTAAHGAALFDADLNLLASAEDVGRHNALDKAVGKLFLSGELSRAAVIMLSSRISYELVQKTGRAQVPILMAKSRPTSLAVFLASRANLTLACASREGGAMVFCGGHRLRKG